jgi:hypothetical protein
VRQRRTSITHFGELLIRRLAEELFYELHAPSRLVAGAHLPGIGLADNLETTSVPQKGGIKAATAELGARTLVEPFRASAGGSTRRPAVRRVARASRRSSSGS